MTIGDSERLREQVRALTRHHRAIHRLLGDLRRAAHGPAEPGRPHHGVGGLHGSPAQDGDAKQ